MNISIKVTYASGTVTEILIPWEEKALTAVSYLGDEDKGVETPSKTQEELDAEYSMDYKLQQDDLRPSGNRYKSVADLADSLNIAREKEEGKGIGRIGGVGERKERGGEEEKPDQETDLSQVTFDTQTTCYQVPLKTLNDFIAAYGLEAVKREFPLAKAWLSANPKKRKTHQGTGRFLNAWLSRAQQPVHFIDYKAAMKKPETGSLLSPSTDSQEGW